MYQEEVSQRTAVLALVAASLPMSLDPAIHNIAVVAAGNVLHMTGAGRALAASLGTLCIAASILTTGSLGDRLGRKKIMLLGLLLSAVGGVITAGAPNAIVFNLGRVASGIGFAASFGLSFALLPAIAPDEKRLSRAVAHWLALQTIGVVVLGLLGGYLAGVSWRVAYLLAPIVAIAAIIACAWATPETKAPDPGRFDGMGLALIAVGLVSVLYGVSNAASAGWLSTRVVAPLAIGAVSLGGFAAREYRFATPAFPIRLFGDRELKAAALSGIAFNMANAVVAIQLSLLWQYVYRYTPFAVSLGQIPFVVASIFAATWAGGLMARGVPVGRLLTSGLFILAAALAVMASAGETTPYVVFIVPLLAAGVGLMLTQTPAANIFVAKSPPALVGAIGSSRSAFGQFGFAFGLALSSSLLYGWFGPLLQLRLQQAGATPAEQAIAVGVIQSYVQTGNADRFDPNAVHEVISSAASAYLSSYRATMLVMAGLIALAAILCGWILANSSEAGRSKA